MDDKLKIFWNLDVLVKMCRSKSDGPSLRIEEVEIEEKIKAYNQEIEEIKALSEEDSYDTSAEMADRNIEIITKKQLQALKNDLKEKNKELTSLKEKETTLYEKTSLLRENKASQEKYIISMQERIGEAVNSEIIDRYNSLIAETSEKIAQINERLNEQNVSYEEVQQSIIEITDIINEIEDKIEKKKKLLLETQANLENKDNYIDKSKKEKNNKRIVDLENKIQKLSCRLEEIKKDPKYLESKIKDVINAKTDINEAKNYLLQLINQVIKIRYINVPADNALEEELLRATQARDSFANEIDQKTYNILEANTPEKVRIEFLTERIEKWQNELKELENKISQIDKDQQYDYESKNTALANMIKVMKKDLLEYERAYNEAPDINIGAKASLKAALDEKKEDIVEAEKIATSFKNDEAEDINTATRTIKYECDKINKNISQAEIEIATIRNRLTSKKSGLIDITSRNKDKDILKELAQTVIDIKHRRQFPETPLDIIKRLEEDLKINLSNEIDLNYIEETSKIETKDYEDYIKTEELEMIEDLDENLDTITEPKRGIKVINEAEITFPSDNEENDGESESESRLKAAILEVSNNEENIANNNLVEENTVENVNFEDSSITDNNNSIIDENSDSENALEIKEEADYNQDNEEEPLDIAEIINENNPSITTENIEENEANQNAFIGQDIEDELDQYINSLRNQE